MVLRNLLRDILLPVDADNNAVDSVSVKKNSSQIFNVGINRFGQDTLKAYSETKLFY